MATQATVLGAGYAAKAQTGTAPASGPVRRLVVVVPGLHVPETDLAQSVWQMAAPEGLPVVYAGLAGGPGSEAPLRRLLANLAALTRGGRVEASARLLDAPDWATGLRRLRQPGDLALYLAGHGVPTGRLRLGRQPIEHVLRQAGLPGRRLEVPGWPEAWAQRASRQAAPLLAAGSALAVIAGAFWLQAQLMQMPTSGLRLGLLMLSVVVEYGLLWLAEALFRR